MKVTIEFSGGIELLFHTKRLTPTLPPSVRTLGDLLPWLRDNALQERGELFMQGDTVRPGILVLVNDADWEIEGERECPLGEGDTVVFISTLHGG
ncbi:ubiquitin-related modifier 1 [Hyaloraphidium curvatum]|nr:ubiquitin-related modifier 1 [Hyaloraphidium curvatum]